MLRTTEFHYVVGIRKGQFYILAMGDNREQLIAFVLERMEFLAKAFDIVGIECSLDIDKVAMEANATHGASPTPN